MQFIVAALGTQPLSPKPFVILRTSPDWNDQGYKTMFVLELYLSNGDVVDTGPIKITRRGLSRGESSLKVGDRFEVLSDNFCSLGQEYTFYEILASAGDVVLREVLAALRDVILLPELQEEFDDEVSFIGSVARSNSAQRALIDARAIISERRAPAKSISNSERFSFTTSVGGSRFSIDFSFADRQYIPSRVHAIIGYNGTGKTRLLANLALAGTHDREARMSEKVQREYGIFDPPNTTFGAVVAISYSAFDIFQIPRKTPGAEDFGYTYCGLRTVDAEGESALKTQGDINDDFITALKRARSGRQNNILRSVFDKLKQEPSFSRVSLVEYIAGESTSLEDLRAQFTQLSTGHKIVLNIAVQLVANLQQRSLILIDEPESHLHPPLLAALLRALSEALESRDSYAVVATHSPVVLQEVPARYVTVLRREFDETYTEPPPLETFGENIGYLTSTVFNLDSSSTDHHSVLAGLSEFSISEIQDMFGGRLSNQTMAYLLKIKKDQAG